MTKAGKHHRKAVLIGGFGLAGQPVAVPTPGTSMAGLDCAEVSPAAWFDLHDGIHGTVTVSDEPGVP